jgi:hypothetical protein
MGGSRLNYDKTEQLCSNLAHKQTFLAMAANQIHPYKGTIRKPNPTKCT